MLLLGFLTILRIPLHILTYLEDRISLILYFPFFIGLSKSVFKRKLHCQIIGVALLTSNTTSLTGYPPSKFLHYFIKFIKNVSHEISLNDLTVMENQRTT